MDAPRARTTAELLSDALSSVSALMRNELDLARAEVADSLRRYLRALLALAVAAVLALTALHVLAGAAVGFLAGAGLSPGAAALAVGGAIGVLAALLLSMGLGMLKATTIAPRRTARNIRRDAAAVKEAYNDK